MYEPLQENKNVESVQHGLRQLARYGLVGLLNTLIDFTLTNTLVIITGASSSAALFVISLSACFVATLNSYRINKTWTFGFSDKPLPHSTMMKYFGVAFLAMMVNTSVFLFVYQFLQDEFDVSRLAGINMAKLVGVATASIFAFLGYRISVFRPIVVEAFRRNFRFEAQSLGFSLAAQLTTLAVGAMVVRLLYLGVTTAVYGDAVNYGWTAEAIAKGQWDKAQSGWTNPFCFWEAIFFYIGMSPIQSAISASFIPGVLLALPVAWIARCYYGERVAWLAGWLTVLHPRLVIYSCNGYSETFYLLALAVGTALLARSSWKECSKITLLIAGVGFGVHFCVRNEGFILFLGSLIGLLILAQRARSKEIPSRSPWYTDPWRCLGLVLAGFFAVVIMYSTTSKVLLGDIGLFKKVSVFSQQYSEQLDPQSSAREVYGFAGRMTTGKWPETGIEQHILIWLYRFPANLLHTLKSTPGVLLTPLWFFAFCLPLFTRGINRTLMPEWPWLVMLFFPIIAYPLLYVEPRLLFASLLPVHLFGAAGLLALSCFLARNQYMENAYFWVASFVLALCLVLIFWRGQQIEQGYAYNRVLADWIDNHVPPGDTLVGCGYGFISTTGFLAQHPTINRLIHYDPRRIVNFVREHNSHWLILYEPFLLKVNPELLPALEVGLPGMKLVFQTKDDHQRRIQIYHLTASPNQVFGPTIDPSLKPAIVPKRG